MRNLENVEHRNLELLLNELNKRIGARVSKDFGAIPLGGNYRPDGYVLLEVAGEELPLVIEVKGHISTLYQIKKLINFSKTFQGFCCLVAEAIDLPVKEQLKANGVGYYEINNELFLPLTYKVFREKKSLGEHSITSNVGFHTESNLKLLFYLVVHPESLKFTQRQLAEKLGISLTSINLALKNLEKVKVISTSSKNEKNLGDMGEIIDRWRISFGDIEKQKLYVGRFSPIDEKFYSKWEEASLEKVKGYWGGEAGAALLTDHYLSPGIFTIYTYETGLGEILKTLRLKKDPKGKIEIVKAFWPEELNDELLRVVPAFLIYCDLLNSGIDRNKETAVMLRKKLTS